ncbi:hypothetical protein HanHA300_Chr16g0620611 [Helianthus annuus]|nr:hypothetical protein HanHA300_Chr16g0620611 [Helianthus annuus]KAJ0461379.1 hypothetical protein HanHA89_Chr16g0671571 [Helianthus annuus]KAJ0641804.1 hypothetical protein HanLR1_Chr16g0631241 [Helianthus annuus]
MLIANHCYLLTAKNFCCFPTDFPKNCHPLSPTELARWIDSNYQILVNPC